MYANIVTAHVVPAPGCVSNSLPVPRVLVHGDKELTEVSGMGINVVHNSQTLRYG